MGLGRYQRQSQHCLVGERELGLNSAPEEVKEAPILFRLQI